MADFQEYVAEAKQLLVLATAVADQPSVRVVGFGQDPEVPERFYVVSKADVAKVAQIQANDKVAFTTMPGAGGKRMSSNKVTAKVSDKTWPEIEPLFSDNKGWHSGHPHPEAETILELNFDSVLLDSFVEAPEAIEFK